ncbi:MAG: hypothetical protein DMF55_09670 [Acidobacteria bacterium]|nr:MAG: hypothetical protein DMF55_09670 [Acidobacteriota bacterium]
MSRPSAINHLAKHIPFLFPTRPASEREAHLYLDRALKAAAEERYDVALVFSRKALDVEPGNLAAQLLSAQLYDHGLHDVDRAVEGYRRVIVLAGYDGSNRYCAAAKQALDALVRDAP